MIWPDISNAVAVFASLDTQWRVHMGKTVFWQGLRYEVITPLYLRSMDVPRREWPQLFEDLRVLERVALEVLNG